MNKKLVIIGAGGHGRVCADIADQMNKYDEICFLDDRDEADVNSEFPIIGRCDEFNKWINAAELFVGIGDAKIRQDYLNQIKEKEGIITTLIHPNAVIGGNVIISYGTAVMAGVVINTGSRIGQGVILNTCCSVDHDSMIEDYAHVSVGAHLAGTVKIGKNTMIGAGATVINNVRICENCMIGAGAVVRRDILEEGTYVGVPAKRI